MSRRKNIRIQLVVNGKNKRSQQHKYEMFMALLKARIAYRIHNWYRFRCINTLLFFIEMFHLAAFIYSVHLQNKSQNNLWIHCAGTLNMSLCLALKNTKLIHTNGLLRDVVYIKEKLSRICNENIYIVLTTINTMVVTWKLWHTEFDRIVRTITSCKKAFSFLIHLNSSWKLIRNFQFPPKR